LHRNEVRIEGMLLPMIWFALILTAAALMAFTAIVVSIQRSERHKNLFTLARGGHADAFTRWVLAVHVHQARSQSPRPAKAASRNLVRR
jgi:hypothetical protein